jgi:hypothetical protein
MVMEKGMANDIFSQQVEKAKGFQMLHHYTSLDALLSIISERRIRLSNLSSLNDPIENERLSYDGLTFSRVFAFCLNSEADDSIPMWRMYTPEIYGVRLSLPSRVWEFALNHAAYTAGDNERDLPLNTYGKWSIWSASIACVLYTDNISSFVQPFYPLGDDMQREYNPLMVGLLKTKHWQFEQETRVRIAAKYQGLSAKLNEKTNKFDYFAPPFKYLFCCIPKDVISKMQILIHPKANQTLFNAMKQAILSIAPSIPTESIVRSSIRIQ